MCVCVTVTGSFVLVLRVIITDDEPRGGDFGRFASAHVVADGGRRDEKLSN